MTELNSPIYLFNYLTIYHYHLPSSQQNIKTRISEKIACLEAY